MKYFNNTLLINKLGRLKYYPNFSFLDKVVSKKKRFIFWCRKIDRDNIIEIEEKIRYNREISEYIHKALSKLRCRISSQGYGVKVIREMISEFKTYRGRIDGLENVELGYSDIINMIVITVPGIRQVKLYKKGKEEIIPYLISKKSNLFLPIKWLYEVAKKENKREIAACLAWEILERINAGGSAFKLREDYLFEVNRKIPYSAMFLMMNIKPKYVDKKAEKEKKARPYKREFYIDLERLRSIKRKSKKKLPGSLIVSRIKEEIRQRRCTYSNLSLKNKIYLKRGEKRIYRLKENEYRYECKVNVLNNVVKIPLVKNIKRGRGKKGYRYRGKWYYSINRNFLIGYRSRSNKYLETKLRKRMNLYIKDLERERLSRFLDNKEELEENLKKAVKNAVIYLNEFGKEIMYVNSVEVKNIVTKVLDGYIVEFGTDVVEVEEDENINVRKNIRVNKASLKDSIGVIKLNYEKNKVSFASKDSIGVIKLKYGKMDEFSPGEEELEEDYLKKEEFYKKDVKRILENDNKFKMYVLAKNFIKGLPKYIRYYKRIQYEKEMSKRYKKGGMYKGMYIPINYAWPGYNLLYNFEKKKKKRKMKHKLIVMFEELKGKGARSKNIYENKVIRELFKGDKEKRYLKDIIKRIEYLRKKGKIKYAKYVPDKNGLMWRYSEREKKLIYYIDKLDEREFNNYILKFMLKYIYLLSSRLMYYDKENKDVRLRIYRQYKGQRDTIKYINFRRRWLRRELNRKGRKLRKRCFDLLIKVEMEKKNFIRNFINKKFLSILERNKEKKSSTLE
jgi:hypothetical protein